MADLILDLHLDLSFFYKLLKGGFMTTIAKKNNLVTIIYDDHNRLEIPSLIAQIFEKSGKKLEEIFNSKTLECLAEHTQKNDPLAGCGCDRAALQQRRSRRRPQAAAR